MRLASEIKNEVIVQLGISTTASFYTDDIIEDFIDRAHKWAATFKKWPYSEGKHTTTYTSSQTDESGDVVYDYPEGWKPDSIRYLQIGGKEIRKKNFYDYKRFREDYPDDEQKVFTDFARQYYINPNADVSGTIIAFGQYEPAGIDFTDSDATTIFSNGSQDANEAILEKALAFAKKREKKEQEALQHEANATRILEEIWNEIQAEQHQYQTLGGDGMFKRFDVLEGGFREDLFNRDQFN